MGVAYEGLHVVIVGPQGFGQISAAVVARPDAKAELYARDVPVPVLHATVGGWIMVHITAVGDLVETILRP